MDYRDIQNKTLFYILVDDKDLVSQKTKLFKQIENMSDSHIQSIFKQIDNTYNQLPLENRIDGIAPIAKTICKDILI